jgi:hypothetical protein
VALFLKEDELPRADLRDIKSVIPAIEGKIAELRE